MDWTVVRRKRAASSSAILLGARHPPSVGGSSVSPLAARPEDTQGVRRPPCDQGAEIELHLLRMRRAVAKVEQSEFFSRFLRQVRDLSVVEILNRSGRWKKEGGEDLAENEPGGGGGGGGDDEDEDAGRGLQSPGSAIELVVYGVGSIAGSEISRCQLALALLLKRNVAGIGDVVVYDPIMSPVERGVMVRLGCRPLEGNEDGRRPLGGPTLFYMPHCDVELYESVLRTNVESGIIDQLVILGNSFRTYQERWSVSPLPQGERPTCLLTVQKSVDETPIVDNFYPNAFNDTSWHIFSKIEIFAVS